MSEGLIEQLAKAVRRVECAASELEASPSSAAAADAARVAIKHGEDALEECRKVLVAAGEEAKAMAQALAEAQPPATPPLMTFDPDNASVWSD